MIRYMDLAGYYPSPEPKNKENEDEFSVIDALTGGAGRFLEHVGAIAEDISRPDDMTPEQWGEHASPWMKALRDEGRAMAERNYHQYEDDSVNYHLQNILTSLPESLAIMGGSMLAGVPVGGLLGAGANFARSALPQAGRIGGMLFDLAKAYQSTGTAGKLARTLTPANAQTFSSAEIGAALEARVEQYEAEQRLIETAKSTGTYVPGQTEQQAREIGKNVFWDNMGIISMFNVPQYNMIMGKAPKSLLGKAGQLIGSGAAESGEEIAQELAAAFELGEPVDSRNIRDAGIAGLGMGIGMHGAGRAARYGYNRATGQPTDEEIDAYIEQQKALSKDESKAEADFYRDAFRGRVQDAIDRQGGYAEDTARLSYNDALNESRLQRRLPALRTWADKHSGGAMSDEVFDSIVRNAQEFGVPVERALATAIAESNGNQDVVSGAGAIGVMQLMPDTAQGLGVDPNDTEQNIRGGIQYLKQQYDRFGDWNLAHAAYNAGAGNVEKAGNRVPHFYETQNYVAKINGFMGNSPAGREGVQQSDIDGGSIYNGEGITYLGEGGKGEGHYWVRQGDNVSFDGAQPDLLNAVDMLGRMFYERTGKKLVVTAGTNGSHAEGEHSHGAGWKVDIADAGANGVGLNEDGALFTADYRAQPFLKEFIEYGRSLGLGMNLEGEGTSNVHIDVALDGTQWDGNGDHAGGFNRNNVSQSRAEELFNERYDPNKYPVPQWQQARKDTGKPLRTGDENTQRDNERKESGDTRSPQDLFSGIFSNSNAPQNQKSSTDDVIAATDKFLEKLRADGKKTETLLKLQTARRSGDVAKMANILRQNGITTSPPQQQPPPKTQETQPPQQQPPPKTQETQPPQQTAPPSQPAPQTAPPAIQPQVENVVQNNQPPENVLPSPQPQTQQETKHSKPKQTQEQKHIKRVLKSVLTGVDNREKRQKQGESIIWLAEKNGIDISADELHGLRIGAPKMVQHWRDNLLKAGALELQETPPAQPQTPPQQQASPPQQETQAENPEVTKARESWEAAKKGYQERGSTMQKARAVAGLPTPPVSTAVQSNTENPTTAIPTAEEIMRRARAIAGLPGAPAPPNIPTAAEMQYRDDDIENPETSEPAFYITDKTRIPTIEDERREYAVRERERRQQEAGRGWQGKQNRELRELEARQAKERSLAEERARQDKAREQEFAQRRNLGANIATALAPPSLSKATRTQQGTGIADLIKSTPFRDMFGTVSLPLGLENSLRNGDIEGIKEAQTILRRRGVRPMDWYDTSRAVEESSIPEVQPTSAQAETAQPPAPQPTFITHEAPERQSQIDADSELAVAPIPTNKRARQEQGKAIEHFLKAPSLKAASDKINATPGLMRGVREGYKQALHDALRIINYEINAQNEAREMERREREAAEARRNEPSEQEKQDAERRLDRRRRDVRDEQADETALSAQENDIDRRYQTSQRATEAAQQGLMQSTAERGQNQRNPEPREETREETQENVTRQEQPAQEDDRDVFDLLPESGELNDVESSEVQAQPEAPTQIEPPSEPPKPKARRSKKEKLYEKYKVDTHPHVKAKLDKLMRDASSKEDSDARQYALRLLKSYEEAPIDNEELDAMEAGFVEEENKKRVEEEKKRKKEVLKRANEKAAKGEPQTDEEAAVLSEDVVQRRKREYTQSAQEQETAPLLEHNGVSGNIQVVNGKLFPINRQLTKEQEKTLAGLAEKHGGRKVPREVAFNIGGSAYGYRFSNPTDGRAFTEEAIASGALDGVTRQAPATDKADKPVETLAPESDELNDVESNEVQPQPKEPTIEPPKPESKPPQGTPKPQPQSQTEKAQDEIQALVTGAKEEIRRLLYKYCKVEKYPWVKDEIEQYISGSFDDEISFSDSREVDEVKKGVLSIIRSRVREWNGAEGYAAYQIYVRWSDKHSLPIGKHTKQNGGYDTPRNRQVADKLLAVLAKTSTYGGEISGAEAIEQMQKIVTDAEREETPDEKAGNEEKFKSDEELSVREYDAKMRGNSAKQNTESQAPADESNTQKTPQTEGLFTFEETRGYEGKEIYVARIDNSKLPLGHLSRNADYNLRRIAETQTQQYNSLPGYYQFKSEYQRDEFIRKVQKSWALSSEIERQRQIEKIINPAKEEAYRILEADKYPEIKDFFNRQVEKAIMNVDTVEDAEDFAKRIVSTVRSYKDAGRLANGVLWELGYKKFGDMWWDNRKYESKYEFISEMVERVENGEITLDEAYEETKHFLKTGKRKVTGETSKPKPKRKKNKKDKLYEKFQADTHPHIKAHLDELFAKAADKTNRSAQKQALALLKRYEEAEAQTEKQLNDIEERFKSPAPRTEQPESAKKNDTDETPAPEEKPAQDSKPQETETQKESSKKLTAREEPNTESKPKRKTKGKWHTVGSAGSREDLQASIREHYHNKNLVIEDDGTVRDPESGIKLNSIVRNNKGRWQLGYYESESQPTPQTETKDNKTPREETKREEKLSDEEARRIEQEIKNQDTINEAPEKLEVNDELRETLHKKHPAIKEAVDVMIDAAQGTKPADRQAAHFWAQTKKSLAQLLVRDIDSETALRGAAAAMHFVWSAKLQGKVSNKKAILDAKANDILKELKDGKITPKEAYRQMGELLYPKFFSTTTEKTESEPKTESPAETHKMPEFKTKGDITEQDLLDLIDQAWDKGMRAELEDIYNNDYKKFDIKDISSTYSAMKAVFEAHQVEENSKAHNGKASATIDDCKSIDDIADYWRAKYNSRAIFAPELNDLYLPAVKEFLKGTEDVFRLFPGFAKKITRVDAFSPFGAVAQYTWSGRNINCTLSFNYSNFKSKESVEELIKKQSPRLHKNASATSIGRHEAGHALASALLRRAGYVEVLKNPLSNLSNIHDSALLYWASELLSPTKKDRLVRDELNEERKKISKYAYEGNGSETVAESIADVLTNGTKAAPLSKAIVQRIKEALVGDTWREHQIISKPFSDFSRLEHKNINTATVAKWYAARVAESKKQATIDAIYEKYKEKRAKIEKLYSNDASKAESLKKSNKDFGTNYDTDAWLQGRLQRRGEKLAKLAEEQAAELRNVRDASEFRKQAEQLLYDRGLAEELAKTKSREEWEALLERRTPDEKILEQDGWTDAKINECAKDTHTANIIEQLGGKIKNGKVTFSNAEDKAAFTRFMELMVDPNARYDIEGGKGTINTDTSNVVSEKDLTPAQKLLVSFGKKLGVRVIFFDNPDGRFRGVHKEGYSLLNINGNKGLGGVFWHESFHWLKNNNPELYKALVKAASITDAQRKAYLETSKRTDLKSNEEIDEEILADMMDDVAKRTGLFQSIAGKNRGLIERVIQWLKDTMNKFIDYFRNPQGKLTTVQAQALADEFGKIANRLKDPNGNQIFRYNRRTHNVELADGREHAETEINEMTAKNAHFSPKFSIAPDDNSNESFRQKIKNLFGVNRRNEHIHNKMKRQLQDLSDMKIAAGHLPEGVHVKIDKVANVIRTGREYDWAHVLPEVGNAVAEQLKITQSADMGNYIAKFILNGAPNDTSAEKEEFAKAMRDNPDMRGKVMAIKETFDTWNNMTAEEQMIASTRYDKEIPPLRERAQKFWQHLRSQFFDSQLPIHYHVAKFEKATGLKLSESINPEIAFRNLRGMQQRAMRMVFGNENTVAALQKFYPNIDFSNWKPLAVILESINATPGSQRYKQFDTFVKARHFWDLHQHNDNILMQQNQVRDEIKKLQDALDKATTKKHRAEIERAIKKREENLDALKKKIMDTPAAFTRDNCADIILKHDDEFGEAQKALVQYSRTLLDIWADSGMISRQRYHQLLNAHPNYVPLHREFDENPDLNTADSMKHMLGSAKDMGDSIAAITNNTFDYIRRAEKNKAKLLLANLANFDGVGGIFEQVDEGTNDGTIIHFYENGKRKALQCSDKTIVEAVNSMTLPTMNLFLKAMRLPAAILRASATGISPGFIMGNFLRDPQDAFIFSKRYGGANAKEVAKDLGSAFNPLVTGKYMLEAMHMGKLFEEFSVSGGAQSDFFSFDRDYKAEAIERLTKKNYQRVLTPKGIVEFLGKLGEWTELATRLRHYEKVKTSRAKEHGGINIYDDLVTAAFESRDLIDFARHGAAGHTWNILTAFANPVLQGFDKQWRTYDFAKLKKFGGTEQTEKEWKISVARLFLGSMLPALVLALLHKDEDWYKDDVQDWEKENYWILSEDFRVPKGADVGVRFFSNLTERLISNDPVTADKVLQPLKGILPDLMPTAFLPIFECMANYDLFRRRPIVPQREINKFRDTPELQYDSQNSKLAVLIGQSTGVSPRYIDHMIYGYTSGIGKEITHALDTVTPGRNAAWTRSDVPFFSRILRTPYRAPKIVSDYYEEFGRQESFAQRAAWERQHGNPNAKPPAEYDRALHMRLKNIQRAMQNLNSQERAIMDDPKLTAEQVEKKREEIQKKRVELCRKALHQAR